MIFLQRLSATPLVIHGSKEFRALTFILTLGKQSLYWDVKLIISRIMLSHIISRSRSLNGSIEVSLKIHLWICCSDLLHIFFSPIRKASMISKWSEIFNLAIIISEGNKGPCVPGCKWLLISPCQNGKF